jgi:outer membrane protein OmpA-like peptidoglycan-associated protein
MREVKMKKQIFMMVLLSVALGLTALAQNNADSSASQAPTTQSTSDREPLQEEKPQGFWDGDDPNVVNLVAHPFANKKYVLRHTEPIKDRLNELDELTSENSAHIKDIDARAQKGLQLASDKANLADQHSTDANNKAQLAQTAATESSTRVASAERMVAGVDEYKGGTQTEIRFRTGQSALSKDAKDALDAMAGPLKDQKSYIIEVRGFSSGHGQTAIASSKMMADSVVRYLVLTHGIPVYRISEMSMGNAPAAGEAATSRPKTGGRVEVSVLQNAVTAQK